MTKLDIPCRDRLIYFLLMIFLFIMFAGKSMAQKSHTVFYADTANELHVYRIHGRKPGKTLLIIGGIQGDEPGGFLAADLYTDLSLEKGNLIVVPRANFPSIIKRRRDIYEDMNRKFAYISNTKISKLNVSESKRLNDYAKVSLRVGRQSTAIISREPGNAVNQVACEGLAHYEARIVKVLKKLIHESDCLLNLHEGSGIYSSQWQSSMRNPKRFGQSIIADTDIFEDKQKGIRVNLKKMADRVITKINSHIKNPEYFFHFNNHRTRAKDSIHKEQRKSATYYALYTCEIPAFGIESTKTLPLEQKIRQPVYAINEFMKILDIIPEVPGINLKKPKLQYMTISVNNSVPLVVGNMHHLKINRGDTIEIMDIKANYTRGLSADILGCGSRYNDLHKKIVIREQTRIFVKKDFYPCGSIFLDFYGSRADHDKNVSIVSQKNTFLSMVYRLNVNGKRRVVKNNDHIELLRGDRFEIEDVVAPGFDPSELIVNLKGFVGNVRNNTGEDRGYVIDTGQNVLMKRYSIGKQGKHYKVITTLHNKEIGRFYIDFK